VLALAREKKNLTNEL